MRSIFPNAKILGIDNSASMIEKAREKYADLAFDICGAENLTGQYDLLFSNACLQWIPNHQTIIPQLMEKLTANGKLAVQMPMNREEPLFRIIRETAANSPWDFSNVCFEKNDTLAPQEYFDILSSCASNFEIWETVYYHAMPSHESLLEWVRGTRLRPYLEVLNEKEQAAFENAILAKVKQTYPFTSSNEVILKFRRLFFVAQK